VFQPLVKGGVVMIPLMLCSVVALVVSIERWLYLRHARGNSEKLMSKVRAALERSSPEEARGVCEATVGPVARVLSATLAHFDMPKDDLREVAREVALAEQPTMDGHLPVLATIVTVSPLLGLLGTISGLIKIFHAIGGGTVADPSLLPAGIAEAMITTFTGLAIAIPFLVVYNSLSSRVEAVTHEIELRVTELLNIQTIAAGVRL
jgi:biopolymer transport protein ExbB